MAKIFSKRRRQPAGSPPAADPKGIVTPEIVDRTWRYMTELAPEAAKLLVPTAMFSQIHLARFLSDETRSLAPRPAEAALPLFAIVLRMFENCAGGPLPPVSAGRIEEAVRLRDAELYRGCRGEDEKSAKRLVRNLTHWQPHVMLFLIEVLAGPYLRSIAGEPSEDDDKMLLALVAVVIALDGALNPDAPAARGR
jgi:hypothetical protein